MSDKHFVEGYIDAAKHTWGANINEWQTA